MARRSTASRRTSRSRRPGACSSSPFILLNLDGLVDPAHPDRPIVDLLFFPAGGGKTEAYLGLAAFAIARRRLNNAGLAGAGLSVVMRYTLRVLTLDQLHRAAGLVCALELERKALGRLGTWPIEIGLWVGGAATPNNLGSAKNQKENTAVYWLNQYRKGSGPPPAPLKDCPWCGTQFKEKIASGCSRALRRHSGSTFAAIMSIARSHPTVYRLSSSTRKSIAACRPS
ncbi:MAG: hypothetical protein WAV18_00135 [Roseiarcus sp.]